MASAIIPPFDQAERYAVARAAADLLGVETPALRVLDVGGHFEPRPHDVRTPIADFLPDCWTVALDRAARSGGTTRYLQGDATALPFADRQFDLVTCLDVLEHVPEDQRSRVVAGLLRTSRSLVVASAPQDDEAVRAAERAVRTFVRAVMGGDQDQLVEHARYGLPPSRRLAAAFEHPDWKLTMFAYGDVTRWVAMMASKYVLLALPDAEGGHAELDRRFTEAFGERDAGAVCYRRFYVAQHASVLGDVAGRLRDRFSRAPAASPIDALHNVLEVAGPVVAAEARRAHERAHEVAALREKVERLEALLRDVEQSMVYKLYKLVGRK